MHGFRKQQLILAVAGTLFALCIHWWNAKLSGLTDGIHTTADDASYLRPAENFANYGTWKDNPDGASAFVQRPPLFGIIHLPFYLVFGNGSAIAGTCFFLLLHGLALFHLPAVFSRFLNRKQALFYSGIYALLPCFWGFLSYQITEALSPSLVILLIAAALHKGKYSLAALLFLFLCCWMLRPLLILLFPIVIYRLIAERNVLFSRTSWWNPAIILLMLIAVFSWENRKAAYLGSWGNLHPIYHASNKSPYRPVHAALTDVFRIWETKPEALHAITGSCWSGDSSHRSLNYLRSYVKERSIPLKPELLYSLLNDYTACNQELILLFSKNTLNGETENEIRLRQRFSQLADSLESAQPLRYHILTPLQGAHEQLTKSQLNLELFQLHYRGIWWTELLRLACLLLIVSSLIFTFAAFFLSEKLLKWLATGALLYVFYLFYVQRLNEDRYLIPLLPLVFITGMTALTLLIKKIRARYF